MPHPSEIERLEGLRHLAARDHGCPPLMGDGTHPLWAELCEVKRDRDALRRRLHEQALATQEAHEYVAREIAASLAHHGIDVMERLGQHPVWQLVSSVVSALVCERDELKSQLTTASTMAADWQRLANVYRERIGKAFAPPVAPLHLEDDGA